jgi:hypothetical protein
METIDHLSPGDIKSFRSTIATTTLKPGTVLWRFASSKHSSKFGAYWIDARTMSEIMRTFSALNNFSLSFKKDVIMDSLALLSNWDTHCEYRVKIELKKEVVAHIGTIGTQQNFAKMQLNTKSEADKALLKLAGGNTENIKKMVEQRIGGYTQYVIPRFRDRSLNQIENEYARLLHFSHI